MAASSSEKLSSRAASSAHLSSPTLSCGTERATGQEALRSAEKQEGSGGHTQKGRPSCQIAPASGQSWPVVMLAILHAVPSLRQRTLVCGTRACTPLTLASGRPFVSGSGRTTGPSGKQLAPVAPVARVRHFRAITTALVLAAADSLRPPEQSPPTYSARLVQPRRLANRPSAARTARLSVLLSRRLAVLPSCHLASEKLRLASKEEPKRVAGRLIMHSYRAQRVCVVCLALLSSS